MQKSCTLKKSLFKIITTLLKTRIVFHQKNKSKTTNISKKTATIKTKKKEKLFKFSKGYSGERTKKRK